MNARPLAHRVLYDGVYTFALRILNVVCAAGLGILTARLLGPSGKGLYALPSVEAALVAAAFAGFNGALSYFLLNRTPARSTVRTALLVAALFVVCAALLIVPLALLTHRPWTIVPAILSLPGSAAINLVAGYALGIKRVRYASGVSVAVTVVTFAMMAGGLFLVARSAWVAIAVWIIASSLVGTAAVAGMLLHARTLERHAGVGVLEFLRFSGKVGAVQIVSLLNYRADLYIVAVFTSAASLGMYSVAVSAAESLLVPTQVASLITSPHIGSLERAQAARLAARCVRNNLLIAVLVCGTLFAIAPWIVRLLYGGAFTPVVPALRILLLGVLALSLGSPMSSYFTLKLGKPELPLGLAATSAAICIVTSVFLVPRIGLTGAALGSTLGYATGQVAATLLFSRRARVRIADLFLPNRADVAIYRSFAQRLFADGRRLLAPRKA